MIRSHWKIVFSTNLSESSLTGSLRLPGVFAYLVAKKTVSSERGAGFDINSLPAVTFFSCSGFEKKIVFFKASIEGETP